MGYYIGENFDEFYVFDTDKGEVVEFFDNYDDAAAKYDELVGGPVE